MAALWNAIASVVTNIFTAAQSLFSRLPGPQFIAPQSQRKEFSVEVVRPDDLLVVTLDFYNLHVAPTSGATPAQIARSGTGNGFVIAHFPPQSFAERAFFEAAPGSPGTEPLGASPVPSRIGGPSRLVFRISDTLLPLDFSLEEILRALARSQQLVQSTIHQPPGTPAIGGDSHFGGERSQFTAIEVPYRLVLSPNAASRWEHAFAPVTDSAKKRTELWHTRLSVDAKAGAVWSPDYVAGLEDAPPPDQFPFRMSLNKRYRHQIVRLSADRTLGGSAQFDLHQLMLSSQGAWLSAHGQWATTLPLIEWRHIITAGRDQYARVVEEGFLFPLGHRAVIVTITERKVQMGKDQVNEGKPVAALRQRKLIFVRQPQRRYNHRHVPFRTVTVKTLVTPNLDPPELSQVPPGVADTGFWPRVNAEDFLFHVVATDWEGREVEFRVPQMFIMKSLANDTAKAKQFVNAFNGLSETDARRARPIDGQKIAFAPAQTSGDTTLETTQLVFAAAGANAAQPRFLPTMFSASVDVPPARHISGSGAPSKIAFDEDYLNAAGSNFGNNGEVFAYLVDAQTPVRFTSDKTGGIVAPSFDISGLSRAFGPVGGDIADFANGNFNPLKIFKDVKLLGGIELGSIISDAINVAPDHAGGDIPQLNTVRTTADINGGVREVFLTRYKWNVDQSMLLDTGMFVPKTGAKFFLSTELLTPLDGTPPNFSVHGEISSFAVKLLPDPKPSLVGLNFTSVSFTAGTNKKADFAVIFDGFEFLGPLRFVNDLLSVIPLDAFEDPPYLDLVLPPDPRPGVNVGFTLGIPTVGVGIFTLQNISFAAGFYLPFIGDPANLRLAFCERHQPFTLTVSLFGGGGFFAIDIGFAGVKQIEAALEFGAAVALNLGVAKGAASIMGGVYYQKSGEGFAISAYFRANGSLSVLGIITISVEFYLALNFESNKSAAHGGKLWGQASVTVKVKIAFFSKSVSISIEREFAGSDPTFLETVLLPDWQEYCNAFDDYPA